MALSQGQGGQKNSKCMKMSTPTLLWYYYYFGHTEAKCWKGLLNACSTNRRHHNSHLIAKGSGLAHFAGQYGTGISDNDYKSYIRFSQCIPCGMNY